MLTDDIEIGIFEPSDVLEKPEVLRVAGHYFELEEVTDNQFRIWVEALRDQFPCAVRCIISEGRKSPRDIFMEFARCNFAAMDPTPDITASGKFNPEFVNCPSRCICKLNGLKCIVHEK